MTSESKVTLKSADGVVFPVPEAVAMELGTVKSFFEDTSADFSSSSSSSSNNNNKSEVVVPLPNVHSRTLNHILRYCHNRIRVEEEEEEEGGEGQEEEEEDAFLKELSNEDLREMLMAANYLHVKPLMDVLVSAAAHRIKNRSVEYVRRFFGIENDFTTEEEDRLHQDSPWAYEGLDPDDDDNPPNDHRL